MHEHRHTQSNTHTQCRMGFYERLDSHSKCVSFTLSISHVLYALLTLMAKSQLGGISSPAKLHPALWNAIIILEQFIQIHPGSLQH